MRANEYTYETGIISAGTTATVRFFRRVPPTEPIRGRPLPVDWETHVSSIQTDYDLSREEAESVALGLREEEFEP